MIIGSVFCCVFILFSFLALIEYKTTKIGVFISIFAILLSVSYIIWGISSAVQDPTVEYSTNVKFETVKMGYSEIQLGKYIDKNGKSQTINLTSKFGVWLPEDAVVTYTDWDNWYLGFYWGDFQANTSLHNNFSVEYP